MTSEQRSASYDTSDLRRSWSIVLIQYATCAILRPQMPAITVRPLHGRRSAGVAYAILYCTIQLGLNTSRHS